MESDVNANWQHSKSKCRVFASYKFRKNECSRGQIKLPNFSVSIQGVVSWLEALLTASRVNKVGNKQLQYSPINMLQISHRNDFGCSKSLILPPGINSLK